MLKTLVLIVIEHLEEKVYPWLYFEYKNAARLVGEGNLLITNVCRESDIKMLKSIVRVTCKSSTSLFKKPIVLDPLAKEKLTPEDARKSTVAIVGGILGDHPPRGRTRKMLTIKFKDAIVRNLGPKQLSIDGAAYTAHMILNRGIPLENIKFVDGVTIKRKIGGIEHVIHLPYRYPVLNDKPIVSSELIEYLKRGLSIEAQI